MAFTWRFHSATARSCACLSANPSAACELGVARRELDVDDNGAAVDRDLDQALGGTAHGADLEHPIGRQVGVLGATPVVLGDLVEVVRR